MYVRSIIYGEMIWAVDGWANCQRGISFFILRKCYMYIVLIFSMPYIPFKILYYSLQFSFLKEFFQSTELVFLFKFMQISNEASIFKWSLLVLLYCTMFQYLKKSTILWNQGEMLMYNFSIFWEQALLYSANILFSTLSISTSFYIIIPR